MRVLGIDPGLTRCGYAVVDGRGPSAAQAVTMGVIRTAASEELPYRLATLRGELVRLITEFDPDVVSVERVFFQTNVRTAMGVGQASGLALCEAAAAGCVVVQYTPNEVKNTVAGVGGPPMAITYQHSDPRTLRASLAAFNTIGLICFTLPSLAIAGVIGRREVQLACLLVPGVIAGFVAGKYTLAKLPPERVRPFVLAVCAASAVVVLARQLA